MKSPNKSQIVTST